MITTDVSATHALKPTHYDAADMRWDPPAPTDVALQDEGGASEFVCLGGDVHGTLWLSRFAYHS